MTSSESRICSHCSACTRPHSAKRACMSLQIQQKHSTTREARPIPNATNPAMTYPGIGVFLRTTTCSTLISPLFIGEGTHTNGAWIHLNLNGREGLNNFDSGSGAQGSSGRIIGYGNTGSSASSNGTSYLRSMSLPYQCFCYTRERPKVEYSYCAGGDITACANQKVADGWYQLEGISATTLSMGTIYQAFWRWAE